jgi:hypothetical protein
MLPHLRFIVAKNLEYQLPFTPVEPHYSEQGKTEFEWSKANNNRLDWFSGTYEEFEIYRAKQSNERLQASFDTPFTMLKVSIHSEEDIKKVEEREDFIKWDL